MVDLPENEYEERVKRAQLAREEARETITEQTQTLSDIDEKAIQIFRINLVIASILIAGLSLAVSEGEIPYDSLVTPYTTVGTLLLFLSTILASVTYTATSERIGIAKNTIEESILNQKYDYDLVEEEIALAYGNMIQYNYKKNASNALLLTLTLIAAVTAISYLAIGIVDLYDSVHPVVNLIMAVFLIAFGKYSGLYGTTKRWMELTDPYNRLSSWCSSWSERLPDVASRGEDTSD